MAQRPTVIGEAVARLTPDITERHKSIPWPLVWQTAVDHAPVLRVQVAEILRVEFGE